MSNDDKAARHQRAERLRAQVNRLKHRRKAVGPDPDQPDESPRDFIERRMGELDDQPPPPPADPDAELED
jgi:hypothetical protein